MSETAEKTKEVKKEKCFVIMPISDQKDYSGGHFANIYEQIIKPAVKQAGYEPYRVDENKICDNIINKIFKAVQECPMAICDLSSRNPNVLYELGLRQAYDMPVVLIQDDITKEIFDVSGIGTVRYKSDRLYENVISARKEIAEAIIATKNGKQNSILQVVNARKAKLPEGSLSQNDKIEIMLNTIISTLEKDKSNTNNIYLESPNKYANRRIKELTDWFAARALKLENKIDKLEKERSELGFIDIEKIKVCKSELAEIQALAFGSDIQMPILIQAKFDDISKRIDYLEVAVGKS